MRNRRIVPYFQHTAPPLPQTRLARKKWFAGARPVFVGTLLLDRLESPAVPRRHPHWRKRRSERRWLIAPRPESAQEIKLAGHLNGKWVGSDVDLTFREDGVRWVIDYKTSGGGSRERGRRIHRRGSAYLHATACPIRGAMACVERRARSLRALLSCSAPPESGSSRSMWTSARSPHNGAESCSRRGEGWSPLPRASCDVRSRYAPVATARPAAPLERCRGPIRE